MLPLKAPDPAILIDEVQIARALRLHPLHEGRGLLLRTGLVRCGGQVKADVESRPWCRPEGPIFLPRAVF